MGHDEQGLEQGVKKMEKKVEMRQGGQETIVAVISLVLAFSLNMQVATD